MPKTSIAIKLFATLRPFTPKNAEQFPIAPAQTVEEVLKQLEVPIEEVQLVFINGVKADLQSPLAGGERVGIFPPVGGG